MFKDRLLSSIILIPTFILLIYFSHIPVVCFFLYIITSMVGFMALLEFSLIAETIGVAIHRRCFIAFGLIYLASSFYFEVSDINGFLLEASFVMVYFISQIFLHFFDVYRGGGVKQHLTVLAVETFGFIYVAIGIGCMVKILMNTQLQGGIWLFFLILISKGTDIFAYIFGSFFGDKKLMPLISPGKTWEGSVGGIIGAMFLTIIISKTLLLETPVLPLLALGLLLSIITQIADLSESLFKREAKIKDSGSGLPGLGGVLDLLDSLLITAPLLYIYLLFNFS